MSLSIVTNVGSLIAQQYLNANNSALSTSITQLSSGLRINTAADDPAGYVRAGNLAYQVNGLNQGVKNTQDATSVIQTALGAINQQSNLLTQLSSLAVQAANTGVNDSTTTAADQAQVDAIVNSINSIAQNTKFGNKILLNGSLGNQAVVTDAANIASVNLGNNVAAANGVNVSTTVAATKASVTGDTDYSSAANQSVSQAVVLGGTTVSFTSGVGAAATATAINTALTSAGLNSQYSAAASGNFIKITASSYGSLGNFTYAQTGGAHAGIFTGVTASAQATGVDIAGTIGGAAATGSGLTLTGNAGTSYAGSSVTVTSAGNVNNLNSTAFNVIGGSVQFQTGANTSDTASISIPSFLASNLGTSVSSGGLNDIKSGGTNTLSTTNTQALSIINQAISDLSSAAAKLGAFLTNTLQPKATIGQVAVQNVSAALSNLQDTDVAAATSQLTKNQILVQAATAVLAQANSAPQIALTLLKNA